MQSERTEDEEAALQRADALNLVRKIETRSDIRFAVGAAAVGFSSVWLAKAHGSDYYVSVKGLMGSLKVSLHPPKGPFPNHVGLLAVTSTYIEQHIDLAISKRDRTLTRWQRPEPPLEGAHCSLILVFPTNHLCQPESKGNPTKPLLVFEPAPKDHAVEVGFFHSREPTATLEHRLAQIGLPMFATQLECGASVSMVARVQPFDPNSLPTEEVLSKGNMRWLDDSKKPPRGAQLHGLNALIVNDAEADGVLRIINVGGSSCTVY